MSTDNNHNIGKTIKTLREGKGYTQAQLAELLNVTDKAVSKWESGGGMPEIMMFPKLAEVFGVTIDYLMIGKAPEEKVVAISKIELCAKNDDVELFNQIEKEALKNKDENGLTIVDYIQKYDAKNVFNAYYVKLGVSSHIKSRRIYQELKIKEDVIIKLLIHFNMLNNLDNLELFKPVYGRTSGDRDKYLGLYSTEYTQYILSKEYDNKELLEKYFSIHNGDIVNPKTRWQDGYSYAFKVAVELNNSNLITYIWNIIKGINENSYNEYSKKVQQSQSEYRQSFSSRPITTGMNYSSHNNYSLVKIEAKTIKLLLDNGYVNIAEEINKLNKLIKGETVSNTEIEVAKMKQEGTHSENDIFVFSCIEDGVLLLDRLFESNDLSLIIKTIQTYPINKIETIYNLYKENNWRQIYEFAVDNDIAENVIENKKEDALVQFIERFWNVSYAMGFNKFDNFPNYKFLKSNKVDISSFKYRISVNVRNVDESFEKIMNFINDIKNRLIENVKLKFSFENRTSGLTKEYFLQQLENGAFETVIIKLYVRLEAYLRKKYNDNDSDSYVLLDKYCSRFNTTDDEANDYDTQTPKLLQKLRMNRNNLVHPEIKEVSLSFDELKKCINIVCSLN